MRALGEALRKAGFTAEGDTVIQAALQGGGLDDKETLVSAIFGSVALTRLEEKLKDGVEPTPEELQKLLTEMSKIPHRLKAPLKTLARRLPHPPGGAPRRFKTDEERKEVCAAVGTYTGEGYNLREAQTKVAKQQAVSLRTVQRTWQENQKRKKPREP